VSLCGALARAEARVGLGSGVTAPDLAGEAGSPAVSQLRVSIFSPVGLFSSFSFASRVRVSRVALGCFRGSFLGFFSIHFPILINAK
jgi:hypothetical protein